MEDRLNRLAFEKRELETEIRYLEIRLKEDPFEFELGFDARLQLRLRDLNLVNMEIAYLEKKLGKNVRNVN